mmetsp:Transcript_98057/g.258977  ORF Transcript_98057/g.258977 Transcript_98057/m.258977 type:complete len:231 (+) Transcript_98057:1608-2300(+)
MAQAVLLRPQEHEAHLVCLSSTGPRCILLPSCALCDVHSFEHGAGLDEQRCCAQHAAPHRRVRAHLRVLRRDQRFHELGLEQEASLHWRSGCRRRPCRHVRRLGQERRHRLLAAAQLVGFLIRRKGVHEVQAWRQPRRHRSEREHGFHAGRQLQGLVGTLLRHQVVHAGLVLERHAARCVHHDAPGGLQQASRHARLLLEQAGESKGLFIFREKSRWDCLQCGHAGRNQA